MRTASQCQAMAVQMDRNAAREPEPGMRAEWAAMASHWRRVARQAAWQDRHVPSPGC